MGEEGYDIRLYTPEMMPEVVDLMVHLWAEDPGVRQEYFGWKYVDNPYTERPLGIVALHGGGVVGFRIQERHFDILSIYDFCLTDDLRKTLKGLRFKTTGLVRTIEKKRTGELPLLIRPVKRDYTEDDWIIEGLDIRKIENWKITEICSDAA